MARILLESLRGDQYAPAFEALSRQGHTFTSVKHNASDPADAELAILDLSDIAPTPEAFAERSELIPDDMPLLVLGDPPSTEMTRRDVAGWLAVPFEPLELVGAVRAVLHARAILRTGELANLRRQIVETERQRDLFAAADQKKDEFISYISHELKNPMASIKGYSDLMRRRLSKLPDDPNRKGLEIISAQVGRMTLLLDQLLDFSRISMDRLQLEQRPVDLAQVVDRLVDELQPTTNRHALQVVLDQESLVTTADENRLRQALQYIVTNAIKFSPVAGTIVVTLSDNGDGCGRIVISDKGIGIPAADLPHVFERFYRGSNVEDTQSGLGLGLYLACEIITRHGGRVTVASELGQGTTFTVLLPLTAQPALRS